MNKRDLCLFIVKKITFLTNMNQMKIYFQNTKLYLYFYSICDSDT